MKNRKREIVEVKNIFLLIIFLILFLGFILWIVYLSKQSSFSQELYFGDTSIEFCEEKCGDFDYISSNNNTQYNFVRCECVNKIVLGDGKYSPTASVNTLDYYFDSNSLEEMTKKEIINRIENATK